MTTMQEAMKSANINPGDVLIECVDCGETFNHTAGEQKFMRGKFGDNYAAPKRCRDCRRKRKEEKEAGNAG